MENMMKIQALQTQIQLVKQVIDQLYIAKQQVNLYQKEISVRYLSDEQTYLVIAAQQVTTALQQMIDHCYALQEQFAYQKRVLSQTQRRW